MCLAVIIFFYNFVLLYNSENSVSVFKMHCKKFNFKGRK
jgi:hypothetical protein